MIKGIFFDVGGTLYSYKNMQSAMMGVLQEMKAKLQLEHDLLEVARHYQLANQNIDQQYADKAFYLVRDYMGEVFAAFLERIGRPHLQSHFDWFEPYQRASMIGCMELKPDCHSTLTRLKDMGLYLSAVSNADENHLIPLVERGELHRWLTHWTSSEAARSCKPDRRFFEIALEKSGLAANQILFVGDSLEQDIQGAHAMGMKTALITELDEPAPMHVGRETPQPDFQIATLSELPGIVEKLNRQTA